MKFGVDDIAEAMRLGQEAAAPWLAREVLGFFVIATFYFFI